MFGSDTTVRLALAFTMLMGACWSDLRTRRVPNLYWVPFGVAAGLLAIGDLLQTDTPLRARLIPFAFAAMLTVLFYLLWRSGMFGGADMKGLAILSFLLPALRASPLAAPGDPSNLRLPATLDAVVNGSVIMLAAPLVFLAWNVARGRLRIPAALLGLPLAISEARERHVWPMQRVRPDGSIAWKYWQRIGGDLSEVYANLERAGVTQVWVTPKVPFLVPLTFGLAAAGLWGNLVLGVMLKLLR